MASKHIKNVAATKSATEMKGHTTQSVLKCRQRTAKDSGPQQRIKLWWHLSIGIFKIDTHGQRALLTPLFPFCKFVDGIIEGGVK
jgi:hypothetical protein